MMVRRFLWIALVVLLGILPGCQGPSPTLVAGSKKTGASGVPDPQIAVGPTLVAAVDTSDVTFYNKAGLSPFGAGTCGGPKPLWCPTNNQLGTCVANSVCSTSNLFSATQLSLNQNLKGKYCDPANPNAPPIKDETGKVIWASSCVVEMGYDSRSLYDPTSQRFWIVAQVRNHVWACTTDTPDPQPGGKLGEHADIEDPQGDQSDPTNTFCHAWLANLAQRYLAVAVSRQGENLGAGFYTYILVNAVGDWPQFTVHDGYLILGHRDPGLQTWVFDANALAAGTNDGSSLKVAPLLVIDPSQLTPPPDSQVIPVNIHGDSQGVTYLLGGYQNNLYIYGLAPQPGNPSKPILLSAAMVPINRSLVGLQVRSPGVFQNGNIYLASHDCAASDPGCAAPFMYVLRVPVKRAGNQIMADTSASGGYMDYAIGKSDTPVVAFEVPALDVTDNGDIVVVYSSGEPSLNKPAGAYYQVFYHGQTGPSNSATLQDPIAGTTPAGNPSGLDLGGAALDPQPDASNKRTTVWISHAYANGGNNPNFNYTSVLGAVKP